MSIVNKIIYESIVQALHQLSSNRTRSFLSLLGISIGIFCIIGVSAAIDSLQNNVQSSLSKLGEDVLYISKTSWTQDHSEDYFKYLRRPDVDYEDYEVLKEKLQSADQLAYQLEVEDRIIKYKSNSIEGAALVGCTYELSEVSKLEFGKGRYFSRSEYNYGAPKAVIGHKIAEELFAPLDPIGKTIRISGKKLEIIGVLKETGESFINIMNYDEVVIVSYPMLKKMANVKQRSFFGNAMLGVQAKENVSIRQLKDEITSRLRAHRRLKPTEKDNFSINQLSALSNLIEGFFGVLGTVGFVIGIFAIFIGAFGIANIMFVSVKERTPLIGVKKALGAKQYMILLEVLIEAIILCFIGGLFGLLLTYLGVVFFTNFIEFEFQLSQNNIITGLAWSISIGLLAGFIPALRASQLDPVVAMRG